MRSEILHALLTYPVPLSMTQAGIWCAMVTVQMPLRGQGLEKESKYQSYSGPGRSLM